MQRRQWIFLGVVLAGLFLDLGTKAWATETLAEGGAIPLASNLELRYAQNEGAAFSMLERAPAEVRGGVFGLAALIAVLVMTWLTRRGHGGAAFVWGAPLVVAGALGNSVDRVRWGYVVDFIRVHWDSAIPFLGRAWPTFNVADIAVLAGAILLLWDSRRSAPSPAPG
ncbi:MAG: signal peptidase II [Myxococcota bacterium]